MTPGFREAACQHIFGTSRKASIADHVCVSCKGPAKLFRSELDQREYHISGLCQACQDEVFNSEV